MWQSLVSQKCVNFHSLEHLKFCHKEQHLEVERLRGALRFGHFVSRCDSKSKSISVSFSYQSHLLPVPDQDLEPDRSPDGDGDTDTDIYNFVCKNLQVSVDFPKIFDKILTPAILRVPVPVPEDFLYPYPDVLYPYPIVPGLKSVPGRSLLPSPNVSFIDQWFLNSP